MELEVHLDWREELLLHTFQERGVEGAVPSMNTKQKGAIHSDWLSAWQLILHRGESGNRDVHRLPTLFAIPQFQYQDEVEMMLHEAPLHAHGERLEALQVRYAPWRRVEALP